MSSVPLPPVATGRYTLDDYFKMEETAVERHEFHEGEVLAMAGGTYMHSCIQTNVIGSLGNRLHGSSCRVVGSDMRLKAGTRRHYVYSDVAVHCGPPQFDPRDPNRTLLNPQVVIEVLSPSTESYDRGRKFTYYRGIDSLQEYVLIAQDEPRVEIYARRPSGEWAILKPVEGLDAAVRLESLNIELPLRDIYDGVPLPLPPSLPAASDAPAAL